MAGICSLIVLQPNMHGRLTPQSKVVVGRLHKNGNPFAEEFDFAVPEDEGRLLDLTREYRTVAVFDFRMARDALTSSAKFLSAVRTLHDVSECDIMLGRTVCRRSLKEVAEDLLGPQDTSEVEPKDIALLVLRLATEQRAMLSENDNKKLSKHSWKRAGAASRHKSVLILRPSTPGAFCGKRGRGVRKWECKYKVAISRLNGPKSGEFLVFGEEKQVKRLRDEVGGELEAPALPSTPSTIGASDSVPPEFMHA